MRVRQRARQRNVELPIILSDHADWDGLNSAIRATGCERVFVTHGYTAVFRKWLADRGYDAGIVQTEYGDEVEEHVAEDAP